MTDPSEVGTGLHVSVSGGMEWPSRKAWHSDMTDKQYIFDSERKEFVPKEGLALAQPGRSDSIDERPPRIGSIAASRTSRPVQRRRKKRKTSEKYFPQVTRRKEKGRTWRFYVWICIVAVASVWAFALAKNLMNRPNEFRVDNVYHVNKYDVIPDL